MLISATPLCANTINYLHIDKEDMETIKPIHEHCTLQCASLTLTSQEGKGKVKLEAEASQNLALVRVVSGPGMNRSQANDPLSL